MGKQVNVHFLNRSLKVLALTGTVISVCSLTAQAQILNGGFETPVVPNGTFSNINAGSPIGAWTVVGNSVLLINTTYSETNQGINQFNAGELLQSVDLTGAGNVGLTSGVTQSVATTAGQSYTLAFLVGRASPAVGFNGASTYLTPSTANLVINGGSAVSFTNSNVTPGSVNWQEFSYSFNATSALTSITFLNGTTDNNFVGLDNVRLAQTAAPEPGTLALLATGGMVSLGLIRRRRKA
jgi:hypothetical protein